MKKCSIGGQAVMEGVMMRSLTGTALAVRREAPASEGGVLGTSYIAVEYHKNPAPRKKGSFPTWPVVRGVYSFIDSLVEGMKIITRSAEIIGEGIDEEPSRFEKWLSKKLGKSVMDIALGVAVVLAIALSLGLFVALPALLVGILPLSEHPIWQSLAQGLIRLVIFLCYLFAVSSMKDAKRLFMYHGAEHKTIACYEAELPLTPENAAKCSRFHPRCGTNFLFLVMAVSILFFALVTALTNLWIPTGGFLVRFLTRIIFLPLVAGLSYEVLKGAAMSDNLFCRIVRAPGLGLQRLTTAEPDEGMLEVAIAAFKTVLDPPDHNIEIDVKKRDKLDKASENKDNTTADKPEAKADEPEAEEAVSSADEPEAEESKCLLDETEAQKFVSKLYEAKAEEPKATEP